MSYSRELGLVQLKVEVGLVQTSRAIPRTSLTWDPAALSAVVCTTLSMSFNVNTQLLQLQERQS